jgi:hypothetical protein
MSISFDTSSHINSAGPLSYTVGAGSNPILFVGVFSGNLPSAITYNSVNLTMIGFHNDGTLTTSFWYLLNPTQGSSQNITVTVSGGVTTIVASSYLGVYYFAGGQETDSGGGTGTLGEIGFDDANANTLWGVVFVSTRNSTGLGAIASTTARQITSCFLGDTNGRNSPGDVPIGAGWSVPSAWVAIGGAIIGSIAGANAGFLINFM